MTAFCLVPAGKLAGARSIAAGATRPSDAVSGAVGGGVARASSFLPSSRVTASLGARRGRNLKGAAKIVCAAEGSSRGVGDLEGSSMDQLMSQLGGISAFGSTSGLGPDDLPTQGQSIVSGADTVTVEDFQPPSDLDYLQELSAIQKEGPKMIGFFGTRNMGFLHQQLIEILSYAMVLTKNHIYTSGATGTNAAVIRGALRAECPELLTVVLPQSKSRQPPESQELLEQVQQVIEMPQNDDLSLLEASRICNQDIISRVQQIICFAFHDSKLLLETCREAKHLRKIVTLFYLD